MTAQMLTAIYEDRRDNRRYWVSRDSRQVRQGWHQMSDVERALQLEAEAREAYNTLFDIY